MALTTQGRTTDVVQVRDSHYVQGGSTDIYKERTGWWERRLIPAAYDDVKFIISIEEEGRPDIIAHRLYQKPELSWLVLQFNNIIDPIEELVAGKQISMPSQSRLLLSILTKPTGGNTVK